VIRFSKPIFPDVDTSALTIKIKDDVYAKRCQLNDLVWNQTNLPEEPTLTTSGSDYDYIYNLFGPGFRQELRPTFHLTMTNPTVGDNGKLVIFYDGHNGTTQWQTVQDTLKAQGYHILCLTMYNNSPNTNPILPSHDDLFRVMGIEAFTIHLAPLLAAVNYFELNGYAGRIAMMGHSGGGQIMTLYCAMDNRVRRCLANSAAVPISLRKFYQKNFGDMEQHYSGLPILKYPWHR